MFEVMIESYLASLLNCKFEKFNNDIEIKSVILFGSVARGQAKDHSDIDIIVVASGLPELKKRDELPPFRSPARIQDIWMTPEELEDMVIAKTGFVVDALLEGKVLFDDGTARAAREICSVTTCPTSFWPITWRTSSRSLTGWPLTWRIRSPGCRTSALGPEMDTAVTIGLSSTWMVAARSAATVARVLESTIERADSVSTCSFVLPGG